MSPAALQESASSERAAARDRRTHRRLAPAELAWVREARLKYGPRVSLIDLSAGGALVQTNVPLRPGTDLVMEILGVGVETVPLRVLRSELAQISDLGAIYQGACQFKRQLNVVARGCTPERSASALKGLALLRRNRGRAGQEFRPSPLHADLQDLLSSVRTGAPASDPLSRALGDLLSDVLPALNRGEPPAVLRARVEERLRQSVPGVALSIDPEPLDPQPGTETIFFSVDGADRARVLNVRLVEGSQLPGWEFRLLQAGSYLLELLDANVETPQASSPRQHGVSAEARPELPGQDTEPSPRQPGTGWQKIVVRYREGRLLKGFSHDFHPSRSQFSLWPSPDSPPSQRMHVPISQLKAVFFVRDFDGDPQFEALSTFDKMAEGRRLEVTFADDEVLLGSTLGYRTDGIGFFVKPADTRGNNLRVFVVSGAIRHVRFF